MDQALIDQIVSNVLAKLQPAPVRPVVEAPVETPVAATPLVSMLPKPTVTPPKPALPAAIELTAPVITAELLARVSGDASADFPYGLYHLVPSGRTCWHEYACLVVAQALRAGRTLKLTPERIQAIGTADYPLPAARPANSCLDTSRLRRTFDLTLPVWQSGVLETLDEILHTQ